MIESLDEIRNRQLSIRKPYALRLCEALEDCLSWYDEGESLADFPADCAREVLNDIKSVEKKSL